MEMLFLMSKKIFRNMIPIKLFVFLPKPNNEEEIRHTVTIEVYIQISLIAYCLLQNSIVKNKTKMDA